MAYTNSPLVTYTNITEHKTKNRKHAIDTITIHCIVAQWTAKEGCDYFATTDRECSANYVVGKDGSIGLSVDEKDRSWCSSNAANDHRAITIEVASDKKAPYAVTNAAYNALISLVADICKRNGIKKLVWSTEKDDRVNHKNGCNMTVHRDYANKSCPGEYLYERHGDIAAKVNAILNQTNGTDEKVETDEKVLYRVQVGAYSKKSNADTQLARVREAGFETYMIQVNGLYKIQVGAYSIKANADAMLSKIKQAGFDAFITTKSGEPVPTAPVKKEMKVGSTVRVNKGAKTYTGGSLASFVYERNHIVKQINVDRVVITYQGTVIAAVKKSDLTLVE